MRDLTFGVIGSGFMGGVLARVGSDILMPAALLQLTLTMKEPKS